MDETSLVGVWTLVSYVITDEQGEVVNIPFGEDPSGLLIYTDSGYMSAQLASASRPHFSQEQLLAASDREKAQAADTYIGYSGTFERQGDRVIHHVSVSFFPNWTGGEQVRTIDLDGEWLRLRGTPVHYQGEFFTPTVTWKRLS